MTDGCIFCQVVSGQIPTNLIYSDEKVIVFLDIKPANKGHALVIPKKHYENLNEIPADEVWHLFEVVQKVSKALEKSLDAEGYNVVMNNKRTAGQLIDHAHVHVIPRYKGDDMTIKLGWSYKGYEGNEMREYGDKLRKGIKK